MKIKKRFYIIITAIIISNVVFGKEEIKQVRPPHERIKIYNDESRALHLGVPIWKKLSAKDNCFTTRAMSNLKYENIKNYDVVVIHNLIESIPYSDQEIESVMRYVNNGGGLLVIGLSSQIRTKAKYHKDKFVELVPVPKSEFCSNQIASKFKIAFSNGLRQGTPSFNNNALNQNVNKQTLAFELPLNPLLTLKGADCTTLVEGYGHPVAVAVEYGKGRAIFVGVSRLFMQYGKLPDRKLGLTDDIIAEQKALFMKWLIWLAEARHSNNAESDIYPVDIYPEEKIETESAQFYFIPQLETQAVKIADDWKLIWSDFSNYLGVESPLQFVMDADEGQKLTVLLRVSRAGGLSGGHRISVPVLGESWRAAGVLSHEVGHKLLGGETTGMSEGSAEWLSARGLKAAGYYKEAQEKLDTHLAEYYKLDPNGNILDITDELMDIRESKACQGKWIWILGEMEKKYGGDFWKRYVKQLEKKYQLVGSHRRYIDEQHPREKITYEEMVAVMNTVAGEDITDWLKEHGIKVKD